MAFVFLVILHVALPAAVAGETVLLADGRTLKDVELKAGPSPERVVLDQADGAPLTVGKDEVLAVDFGKTEGKNQTPWVRLLTGDQFVGKVTFPGSRQVKVGTAWGTITVPFAWCAAIRLVEKMDLPAQGTTDAVWLTNGDRAPGVITDVKDDKIRLRLNDQTLVPLPLERVRAMTFAQGEAPAEAGSSLQIQLDLGGGERLTGRWLGLAEGMLKVQPLWGAPLDIPLSAVSRLEVKNGKLVYLSDLKPVEATHVPYLDGAQPHRVNRSVGGGPLRLSGKVYARGLGVHSQSSLKYNLNGAFKSFTASAGIDSEVGASGSVVFRVYGDDRLLFESGVVRGAETPTEISVDVSRVGVLRLEVTYADEGDSGDHANWADARLLRS